MEGKSDISYIHIKHCLLGFFSRFVSDELKEPFFESFIAKGGELLKESKNSLGRVLLAYIHSYSEDYDKKTQ